MIQEKKIEKKLVKVLFINIKRILDHISKN